MIKYLFIALLLATTVLVPSSNLYSWTPIWYSYVHAGKTGLVKKVDITDGFDSLDFSETAPQIELLELRKKLWENCSYLAEDDAGLRNNINVKTLTAWGEYPQIPVSLSYLPNVERYEVSWTPLNNFDYLSRVLPSLKTLFFYIYDKPRESMVICLENISKLEFLENLAITTDDRFWGGDTLTEQEIEALSKMHNLKTLVFEIHGVEKDNPGKQLSSAKLQILRDLLPNTKIEVQIRYYTPSSDW